MSNSLPSLPDPSSLLPSPDELGGHHAASPLLDEPGPAGPATPKLARYLAAVARNKWLILGVTALGTGAGVVASRFVRPQYEVQATVWVESSNPDAAETGPIRSGELLQYTAWMELLKSYQVLDPVIRDQQLYIDAPAGQLPLFRSLQLHERFRPSKYSLKVDGQGTGFVLSTADGIEVQRGTLGQPIGEPAGFDWRLEAGSLKPNQVLEFEILNPRDVAVELSTALRARMAPQGNFLSLSLQDTDPERMTRTLNGVLDRYVEVAKHLKRAKLDELTSVLDEQRLYAEQNLQEAEIALETFRVATVTLPSDREVPAAGLEFTRDPVFNNYFAMKTQREGLRQEREAVERAMRQVQDSAVSVFALAAIPAARSSESLTSALQELTAKRAELRTLRFRYTADHPQVRKLDADIAQLEKQVIPGHALSLRDQLLSQENALEQRINSASDELRQIPPRSIEEARLARRVAIADNLHSTLKQRYEEARLAAASSIPDIRVLDRAVTPYAPISDTRKIVMLLGFVGALGLSLAVVILMDHMDPRVRYPEQITQGMGLPILGAIPEVKKTGKGDESATAVSEALRELRFGLVHAYGTAGPLMLTVSSPESGDGKSFVTSNLALAFADQGFQTLVIDGDVRRGGLHHLLQSRRVPGLTDYLAGNATIEEIVRPTGYDSIWVIPSGTRIQNAPELLGSPRMAQLINTLRSRFGVILVDSPPLGAGVDPYILGTLTQNLLLVLRSGTTHRAFAEAKLGLLDRLPIRLVGAVLNAVPSAKVYGRVYGYHPYLPGYASLGEEASGEVEETAGVGAGAAG